MPWSPPPMPEEEDVRHAIAAVKHAKDLRKIRLRQELCGSCKHASHNIQLNSFLRTLEYDKNNIASRKIYCHVNQEVCYRYPIPIGYYTDKGPMICGVGVRMGCPMMLEYIMINEQDKETNQELKKLSPVQRALTMAKIMRGKS